jgi:hypothetical protein
VRGCCGVVRLAGDERGERQEEGEGDDQTASERHPGDGGQVEPLVCDQEDGGPTIPLPAAADRCTR